MGNGKESPGMSNLIVPNPVQCPLLVAPMAAPTGVAFAMSPCIMTRCAWFDTLRNQCQVVTISQKLSMMPKQEATDAKRG
jgi:hypothetical protein